MSNFSINHGPLRLLTRRGLIARGATLSAGTVALLAGQDALAAAQSTTPHESNEDIGILNGALAAELQAIAAYGVGAGSGLLKADALKLAQTFRGHHQQHADVLRGAVTRLGGNPVEALKKYDFPLNELKSQNDVLRFAATLERGAVSAYLGAVPLFADRQLAKAAASILGDEAMHWAVLRNALGEEPVPAAFVS